jgi:hypothetical protein
MLMVVEEAIQWQRQSGFTNDTAKSAVSRPIFGCSNEAVVQPHNSARLSLQGNIGIILVIYLYSAVSGPSNSSKGNCIQQMLEMMIYRRN